MVLRLRNKHLSVAIDVEHGATIRHLGPDDEQNLLASYSWEAPLSDIRSMSYGNDRLDWLSRYRGGWDVLFPNAGAACEVDGIPLPFHGEVSSSSWDLISHDASAARMQCGARLPLVIERRVELPYDQPMMRLTELVRNVSDQPVSFLWGHHPAFDVPPESRVDLPPDLHCEVAEHIPAEFSLIEPGTTSTWPNAQTPTGGVVDLSKVPRGPVWRLCYLRGGASWAALRPPSSYGIAISWDPQVFPVLWFWQQIGGPNFPWFGRANITALEPSTTSPSDGLAAAIARRDAHRIEGGCTVETSLTATLLPPDSRPVRHVETSGDVEFEREDGRW